MGQAGGAVPPIVDAFIKDAVTPLFEGIGAVSDYGLRQYDNSKLGMVQHITAGRGSIHDLHRWFADSDSGATHFGIEREERPQPFAFGGVIVRIARVGQYVPTVGRFAPWAQGVQAWLDNPACDIKIPAHLKALPPSAANPAFISVENIAVTGADLVTDWQFNSNVFLRAWAAAYFRYPINPQTQLWHSEFDPWSRCFDPGWPGELEDEMQAAASLLLAGDVSGLRRVVTAEPPAPAPVTRAEFDALIKALYGSHARYIQTAANNRPLEQRMSIAEDNGDQPVREALKEFASAASLLADVEGNAKG